MKPGVLTPNPVLRGLLHITDVGDRNHRGSTSDWVLTQASDHSARPEWRHWLPRSACHKAGEETGCTRSLSHPPACVKIPGIKYKQLSGLLIVTVYSIYFGGFTKMDFSRKVIQLLCSFLYL